MAERDQQCQQLQAVIDQKMTELEVQATSFAGETARLEAAVAERDQQCQQLQAVIDQKMTELEVQAVMLRDRDSKIVEFRAATAAMEAEGVRREEVLTARDAKIAALESLSGFAVEAEALRMTLSNAQAEIAVLRSHMGVLDGRLLAYEATIAANEARILELAASAKSHGQLVTVLREQGARASDREAEQLRTIQALNARLDRIHAAWVFRLDSALVRSVKTSAFGLARPAPLLLTSRPTS
ncbi:MAG: chromosome segregation protein [Xanthobacteraceae bacterium]|nr:MAG: chromosome segregation protein [Xanthobacteraceae bacterium]